ncbi:hypothetical protein B0H10DRAFT_1947502 [Mycena sp. CBHHK59/15]|nr:hypothetical protein B0H10DRAFT_1947502 [Mycena sp. CBHHK59/15]
MRHEAIVILRNPHNHPMHPSTKPSAEDKFKLGMAVKSTGLTGFMVQKLLNGLHPLRQVFMVDSVSQKAVQCLQTPGKFMISLVCKRRQNILTEWGGKVLSLVIDFIFKQVEGKMDEWEVVGIVERFKKHSLYCDTKTQVAFAQLFTEFFDAVSHVTGERFKLAPFYPDATCWAVILDGEVPQAQGFGNFLTTYNNPEISQIQTSGPLELLPNSLKTCCLHFEQHIEELPQNIPKYVIAHLKSILGLKTKEEIYNWHTLYASQEDPTIKSQELVLMEHDGVTPNRWNGSAQREKLSGQHQKWEAHKAAIWNSQLTSYDTLKEERNSGAEENKASLERQRSLEAQIKLLQDKMKLDWHHTDLQEQIIALWKDVEAEMSIRREWAVRRAEIDKEIQRLRDSRLAGARLKGRRPSEHPVGDDIPLDAADEGDGARMGTMDDHLDVGLQAFESNSPVHVNDTVPELNSGHCVLGVLPPDHVTEFNSSESPQPIMFNSNGLGTNFLHEFRANMNSDLPVSMFADAGPAPAEYVNYTFHDGLHISGKQSADDLEYISSPTIDLVASALGPGELVHGIESGMENHLEGLKKIHRLVGVVCSCLKSYLALHFLHLPPFHGHPDQSIANENVVDPQPEDDNIAPRDINLAFDERILLLGNAGAPNLVVSPTPMQLMQGQPKRDQNSTSLKLWEVFWEFNFMVMRVQEFNFLLQLHAMATGIQLPFSS